MEPFFEEQAPESQYQDAAATNLNGVFSEAVPPPPSLPPIAPVPPPLSFRVHPDSFLQVSPPCNDQDNEYSSQNRPASADSWSTCMRRGECGWLLLQSQALDEVSEAHQKAIELIAVGGVLCTMCPHSLRGSTVVEEKVVDVASELRQRTIMMRRRRSADSCE